MIRITKERSKRVISTYYDMKHEDEAFECKECSLTDQSYFFESDLKTLVKNGMVQPGARLVYGQQDNMSLDELKNLQREFTNAWDKLSKEEQKEFGSFGNFVDQVTDIRNYTPTTLEELPVIDEKENYGE